MSTVSLVAECPVYNSFRVQQVAGMFDVPLSKKSIVKFSAELPNLSENWQIGTVVGPSGSGKTSLIRGAYGDAVYQPSDWPIDKAVIDGFGDVPIKVITHILTAVGFSSPPAWIKPYQVLSNGERFRCDLARALLKEGELVVFDEFTSVVDRTVAKISSAAVAKTIRTGRVKKRFVAVTCHYDIIEWLTPDWVLDMATCQLARGCLRRPEIALEIFRCSRDTWRIFANHHYLTSSLPVGSECYLATWNDEPIAFIAICALIGKKNCRRVARLVVLPDYQGVGIGSTILNTVCEMYRKRGLEIYITTGHPAVIRSLRKSPNWKTTNIKKYGIRPSLQYAHVPKTSFGRCVVGFRFIGGEKGGQGRSVS